MNLRRFSVAVALAITVLTRLVAQGQDPELVIPDTLQFAPAETFTFHVFATSGRIGPVVVQVKDFKSPGGQSGTPPIETVRVAAVTPEGAAVTLTARANAFPSVGEYRVTLLFSYTNPAAKLVQVAKLMTITRPKPEIAAPHLKDYALKLKRSGPWCAAHGIVDVELVNNGSTAIGGMEIRGGPVTVEGDPKEVVVGPTLSILARDGTPLQRLDPGPNNVRLNLSGFDRAGTFQARLEVKPSGELPAETIPFRVIVSDGMTLPLLTILIGVGLAFVVNLLATRYRPAQEIRARVLKLSAAVVDAGAASRAVTTQQTAADLLSELRLIDAEASFDPTALSARLESVALRVTDLRTSTYRLVNEVTGKRGTLKDEIEALKRKADSDARRKTVTDFEAEVAALDKLMAERLHDRAAERIAKLVPAVEKARTDFAQPAKAPLVVRGGGGGAVAPLPPQPAIAVSPEAPVIGEPVTFSVVNAPAGSNYTWQVDDDDPTGPAATHDKTFYINGAVEVTATPAAGGTVIRRSVVIARKDFGRALDAVRKRWWVSEVILSAIGLVFAVATGLWWLWANRTFGTPAQYIEAFVWGFGVDSSVRGVAAVMNKVRGG